MLAPEQVHMYAVLRAEHMVTQLSTLPQLLTALPGTCPPSGMVMDLLLLLLLTCLLLLACCPHAAAAVLHACPCPCPFPYP